MQLGALNTDHLRMSFFVAQEMPSHVMQNRCNIDADTCQGVHAQCGKQSIKLLQKKQTYRYCTVDMIHCVFSQILLQQSLASQHHKTAGVVFESADGGINLYTLTPDQKV